jgi:quinoprotein glucose dehydrogenase
VAVLLGCCLLGTPATDFNLSSLSAAENELEKASDPVEPRIAGPSNEAETAISTFKIPEGWKCEVFAAEPDVANPVAIYIDNQNRVFVCESYRQNQGVTDNRKHDDEWLLADLQAKTVEDRIAYHKRLLGDAAEEYTLQDDRIRMLVDTDDNGSVDESVVFASNFNQLEDGTGAGVLVRGTTAYYTCIPNLWKLEDVDNDGKSESREVLSTGYGVRVAFRGHDMHGLIIGHDGRLYFSIGDRGYHVETEGKTIANSVSGAIFRCELDGTGLEVFADGMRNPQELAFDDYGRLFTGDNNSDSGDQARWVYSVPGADSGWRMYYQYLSDRGPFNREMIWGPYDPDVTPAYIVPPIANVSDGPAGLVCYPGTGLGEQYKNKFFLCDFRGQSSNSGVRLLGNSPKGAFFELTTSEEPLWQILCTDAAFGPDGALYVSDWVNGWDGEGKGRIYRFTNPEAQKSDIVAQTRRLLAGDFTQLSGDQLGDLLPHADRRVRLESQWELASRGDASAVSVLAQVASDTQAETVSRLHGVWGLSQIARGQISAETAVSQLISLLSDDDEHVVAAAITGLRESMSTAFTDALVLQALENDSPIVQCSAGYAVSQMNMASGLGRISEILAANSNDDPILRHAMIMALTGCGEENVALLSSHANPAVRLAAVVALRRLGSDAIAEFLTDNNKQVVVEAARAIHDSVELHGSMDALAALLADRTITDEAIVSRAINASYRAGGAANATLIANYAADNSRPMDLRMNAIESLDLWTKGTKLDRVLNDYRPVNARSADSLKPAFEGALVKLATQPDDVRAVAIRIASELKLSAAEELLRKIFTDRNAPQKERAIALKGLFELGVGDATGLAESAARDDAAAVRIAALVQLVEMNSPIATTVASRMTSSSVQTERQAAWDGLANLKSAESDGIIAQGYAQLNSGDLPKDVWLNVLEAASGRIKGARTLSMDVAMDAQPDELLERFADCTMGGDILNGRELFFGRTQLSCVRCHQVGSKGGQVGPVLTELGKEKDSDYLLESIVAPSAHIAKGFETVVVATEDGEVITGIFKSEDDEFLNLVSPDGAPIQVEQEIIIDRKPGLSSMPADLLKYLSRRELRDLVTYLKALDGKHPEALPAEGVSGGHE